MRYPEDPGHPVNYLTPSERARKIRREWEGLRSGDRKNAISCLVSVGAWKAESVDDPTRHIVELWGRYMFYRFGGDWVEIVAPIMTDEEYKLIHKKERGA